MPYTDILYDKKDGCVVIVPSVPFPRRVLR